MDTPILEMENLVVRYASSASNAVHNIDLKLGEGECVGLIGESGSGKSSLALSVMGLGPSTASIEGSVRFRGTELLTLPERELDTYRWSRIAMVFQNSLDVLNPVLTIETQIAEAIRKHLGQTKADSRKRAVRYMEMVGLQAQWAQAYPHQLSGGMRQKVLIAMALSCDPEVLLVDEPTMALDSVAKQEIVALLLRLQKERNFSMLVISHELPVIAALTSRVLVMYAGNILEEGGTDELIRMPNHPYTKGLVSSSPAINPFRDMWGIVGEITAVGEGQCPFYSRCHQRIERCAHEHPVLETVAPGRRVSCLRGGIVTLLKGTALSKRYQVGRKTIEACSDCDIEIKAGEVSAVIGESGSGKTTVAEILAGIIDADEGEVSFEGRRVSKYSETSRIGGIQLVFQDPLSSTNEHLTIEEIVREPLDILKTHDKEERNALVVASLRNVQLPHDGQFLKRRGFTLSGGQRQRLAVARALVMHPKLLIADEISAMLDPSTAANLLRLLKGLQNSEGFSMVYITHDLALAQKISDTVHVMHKGRIIEKGPVEKVLWHPEEEYTKTLVRGLKTVEESSYSFS